jgi:hypothetical protein
MRRSATTNAAVADQVAAACTMLTAEDAAAVLGLANADALLRLAGCGRLETRAHGETGKPTFWAADLASALTRVDPELAAHLADVRRANQVLGTAIAELVERRQPLRHDRLVALVHELAAPQASDVDARVRAIFLRAGFSVADGVYVTIGSRLSFPILRTLLRLVV